MEQLSLFDYSGINIPQSNGGTVFPREQITTILLSLQIEYFNKMLKR